MKSNLVKIGIVIPIYQTKFIEKTVNTILQTNYRDDLMICIVNDGKAEVATFLSEKDWGHNILIENLKANRCFAGANNAGWQRLIREFPQIEYLGTLNDDTIPRKNWLNPLINALKTYSKTAIAAPIMETNQGFLKTRRNYAIWHLKNHSDDMKVRMIPVSATVKEDCFCPIISGFCFLANRQALEDVNFFDERYVNSMEDVDLCLNLLVKKWRIIVCKDSYVYHYAGQSRYLPGAPNMSLSENIFYQKWTGNLERFNCLNSEGFLSENLP